MLEQRAQLEVLEGEATACILCELGQLMVVAQEAAWVSNSFCRDFMWKGLVWCFSDNPACVQSWPESAVVAC